MTKFQQQKASRLIKPEEEKEPLKLDVNKQGEDTYKVFSEIPASLYEKLGNYVFWTHYNQSEVIRQAIEKLLEDYEEKPLPEHVLSRKKPGRPRRS